MKNCETSLLIHLKNRLRAPEVRTIKAYAGEFAADDPEELSELLPAIFVTFTDGRPLAQERQYEFSLLVVTESDTIEKLEAQGANLELSETIAEYLRENYLFARQGGKGTYEILREQCEARTLRNADRFCIVQIRLWMKGHF